MIKAQLEIWPSGCLVTFSVLTAIPVFPLVGWLGHYEILLFYILPLELALLLFIGSYRKRASLLRAVDQGMIEQEQGEVVWQKGKYVARTPTRRQLITLKKGQQLPPPGPYHFYYLAEKAVLLSAKPIKNYTNMLPHPGLLSASGLPGHEQARIGLQEALGHALNFSRNDLACNRRRELSEEQRKRLYKKLLWKSIVYLVSMPIGVVICVWAMVLQGNRQSGIDPIAVCLFILGLLITIAALYYLTQGANTRYQEIREAEFKILEGPVHQRKEGGGSTDNPSAYYYEIDSTSIFVTERAYKALVPKLRYRLYYLPRMKELMSIEPLEPPMR